MVMIDNNNKKVKPTSRERKNKKAAHQVAKN
jgi:hypothetical protein